MRLLPGRGASHAAISLAAATFCGAWPLAALQGREGRGGPLWTVEGLRAGQCVRFLMDPAVAGDETPAGFRPVRADGDQGLHPAIRSVVDAQPEFAPWTPASLCLFYADAIHLGAQRFGNKDPRKKQLLGFWNMAAVEQATTARRDIVLELFGTGGDLVQAAERAKVKFREARSGVSKVAGSGNDLYNVKLGNTRLVWNGRATGDSTAVVHPIEELWLARGASGTTWRIRADMRPAWTRPLVGVLSVEGKDDLAKALKHSPTRFVGPLYTGGGGVLRFSR